MTLGLDSIIDNLVKEIIKPISNKLIEAGNTQYKRSLVLLEKSFVKYLRRSYDRYSKMKTLLYRDQPVSLRDHYVSSDFKCGKSKITGESIVDKFIQAKRNIVVGTAGSGKSVLLRKIFIDLIEYHQGLAPILVELRLLESKISVASIFSYIYSVISDLDVGLSEDQLEFALRQGKVVLLLDGFDEIDFSKRDSYEREILGFSHKYPEAVIVVSSRPDDCFSSWDEFYTYKALPLNKSQAKELIKKIDYDSDVKAKFIGELERGLYKRHSDFLSNPLLLTMMLLTYEQLAEIPEKIHIFYEQAFDTLFHKHDALKSLYKRKSYSEMPIDDFKRLFSAFCILTYLDRKFSFSDDEIIEYINRANNLEGIVIDPNKYFNDLTKSVCIIQKDGNFYTFTHRSFQEYFAACFISRSQSINYRAVLDAVSMEIFRDSVIETLFEINRERVETGWVIPKLNEIVPHCRQAIDGGDYAKFLNIFYGSIGTFDDGIGFTLERDRQGIFVGFLNRFYKKDAEMFFNKENLSDEQRDSLRKIEAESLARNCGIGESEHVRLEDLIGNSDWTVGTDIPEYCKSKHQFISHVLITLSEKYTAKENNLKALVDMGLRKSKNDTQSGFNF